MPLVLRLQTAHKAVRAGLPHCVLQGQDGIRRGRKGKQARSVCCVPAHLGAKQENVLWRDEGPGGGGLHTEWRRPIEPLNLLRKVYTWDWVEARGPMDSEQWS